ncbi:MAG TPA: TIGR03089 family protein [Candidatus Nanopelagicales bacterium]|nr:TIGR03089 family protein [Candidatus Nanopelagicales bacterium]
MTTPYAALRDALVADPARPLVTYVGPEGRTELSVRTFENGVAKAAGLLRDGYDVEPGDVVALLLPAHWQTAVWLGACWAAGAVASFEASDVDDAAVALACADRLVETAGAAEVLRVSRHPFGLPSAEPLPAGVLEAATEVRAHSDDFTPYAAPGGADPALRVGGDALTNAEVMAAATAVAARLGLTAGRLLTTGVTDGADSRAAVLALLAVPLAVGASVVIAAPGTDLDELTRTEGVTARL